jgi:predicted O-linked N-acetylglucosamine transferase (SPINDLY family)
MARSPDDAAVAAAALTDSLADPDVDTAVLSQKFRNWGGRFGVTGPANADAAHAQTLDPDKPRLTIGLLVASEGAGAAQRALAEAFVHRNAGRFTLVGFGFGSLGGGAGAPFQNAVDRWRDVGDADPLTMGAMIRAEGIDVLVDLAGFAAPHLLTGLAARLPLARLHG